MFSFASPSCGLLHHLNHLLVTVFSNNQQWGLNLACCSSAAGLASTVLLLDSLSLHSHFQVTLHLQAGYQPASDCRCAKNVATTVWTFIKVLYYVLGSTLLAPPIMELITLATITGSDPSILLINALFQMKVSNLSFISSQVTAWAGWICRVTITPKINL